ncbi:hypothetical protein ABZS53_04995, partial [Streptomyces sp. NPDC005499]|uniref:hypothetical protein n=1 Tax=Streptomyces sp. NPDC005499 TaxID=3154883 RepID=UPI0033B6E259
GTTNLPKQAGVSTYLALTFGTLLSSQGTDASFVLTLSGFPPGFSLRSCVSDSIRLFRVRFPVEAGSAFQFFAFAFPFSAAPTLPDSFSFRFRSEFDSGGRWNGLCLSACSPH